MHGSFASSGGEGQVHVEGGAAPDGADDFDSATVLSNEFADDGEAKTGAVGFGGKVGSKYFLNVFGSNAAAGVANGDADVRMVGVEVQGVINAVDGRLVDAVGGEMDCTLAIYGLKCVDA